MQHMRTSPVLKDCKDYKHICLSSFFFEGALDAFGLKSWPSLVLFQKGIPIVFEENLKNIDAVIGWITRELSHQGDGRLGK